MLKIRYITCLFLLCISVTKASYKNLLEAEKISIKWLQIHSLSKSTQLNIKSSFSESFQGREVYHIINLTPKGFIIVSADDNARPVLAFSQESNFDIENSHPELKRLLNQYSNYVYKSSQTQNSDNQMLWNNIDAMAIQNTILPLMKTKWDQHWPYNKYCPVDSTASLRSNYRTYTGCVATAMSQIMKYYNYPYSGAGTHSYTHNTYGRQSVNFDTTIFEWDSMPNKLLKEAPENQIDAVANLMYHAGVGVNMDYGHDASGAYSSDVPDVMVNNFKYSPEIRYINRNNMNEEKWLKLVAAELSDNRPIYYSGDDGTAGHAFVCDGYQDRGKNGKYLHFNWGWSGSGDGYFTINNMTFNYGQDIIINIAPAGQMANFEVNKTKGVAPLTVTFTDFSEGNPDKWEWDFNDDGIIDSYEQNPSWTFENSGQLPIMLRVSRGDTISYQKTKADYLDIQASNQLYGTLAEDRTLYPGTIKVLGNTTVPVGKTLTIKPGAILEFQNSYHLKVDGNLNAIGSQEDSITFTIADSTSFFDPSTSKGGWKGILFTGKQNDTTNFSYCNFHFVKNSTALQSVYNENLNIRNCTFSNIHGVAIELMWSKQSIKIDKSIFKNIINPGTSLYKKYGTAINSNFSKLNITNSIFHYNVIDESGLIKVSNQSSLTMQNNTIVDNYCKSANHPVFKVTSNSRLNLLNNILWNNAINEIEFSGTNQCYLVHNNLQSGLLEITGDKPEFINYSNNINIDPQFDGKSLNLAPWSQCIDRGVLTNDSLFFDFLDIYGKHRTSLEMIDIGATEFNGEKEKFNIGFDVNINQGLYPLTVVFSDTTKTDDIIGIKWDFQNDGQWDVVDSVEVSHTYTRPGTYTVSMLAIRADSIPVFVIYEGLIKVTDTMTNIGNVEKSKIPEDFFLNQNYPNPFNPSTTINYGIPTTTKIKLEIFDILGNKVTTLVNSKISAGKYSIIWNGLNDSGQLVPSGIYFYKIDCKEFTANKKMFFMK